MRLSESLRKGVMESFYGGLVNRFKIRRRRVTLFFGDIFIDYLKECEKSNFRNEMVSLGQKWMVLYFGILVPSAMKRLPVTLLNIAMKKVWVNLGLMDDFKMEKKDSIVTISTRNEAISKAVGGNGFSVGLYMGILNVLYESDIETISVKQTSENNTYVFRITGKTCKNLCGKGKDEYVRLNALRYVKGLTLKDALRSRILVLDDNKIYFRGRHVYAVENTLFHIIGNMEILLEKVQNISCEFFRGIVASETSDEKKLVLLKTLLQVMGWGIVKIAVKERLIDVDINSPPFGLQRDKDNWEFLARTILGYLWIIDRKFTIKSISESEKHLRIVYAR